MFSFSDSATPGLPYALQFYYSYHEFHCYTNMYLAVFDSATKHTEVIGVWNLDFMLSRLSRCCIKGE